MATNITTPNLGLVVPTPGQEPGPAYAIDVSDALVKIDGHTHTGASNSDGAMIPAAGLNFNADITAQNHNLTSLRSTRFTNQNGALLGVGDVGCTYERAGDLWYNNSAGVPIQLTAGPAVISALSTSYAILIITTNHTINPTDPQNFFGTDTTSAVLTLQLPASSSVPPGRFYIVKDKSGAAPTHNVTVARAGSDTIDGAAANYVLKVAHQNLLFVNDGLGNWMLFAEGDFGDINAADINAANVTTAGNVTVGVAVVASGSIKGLSHKLLSDVIESRTIQFSPTFLASAGTRLDCSIRLGADDGSAQAGFTISGMPNGANVTSFTLNVLPGPHGGFLPSSTIAFQVIAYDLTVFTATPPSFFVVPFTNDPTTPSAAYDANHSFTVAVPSGGHIVDNTKYKYVFNIVGENDVTHGVVGGLVVGVRATWTRLAGSLIGED